MYNPKDGWHDPYFYGMALLPLQKEVKRMNTHMDECLKEMGCAKANPEKK